MTFKQWLRLQTPRHRSLVGDLARDATQDARFPDAALMSRYVVYLGRHHASPRALKALAIAWNEWLHGGASFASAA